MVVIADTVTRDLMSMTHDKLDQNSFLQLGLDKFSIMHYGLAEISYNATRLAKTFKGILQGMVWGKRTASAVINFWGGLLSICSALRFSRRIYPTSRRL